jgi:hypothetical protein
LNFIGPFSRNGGISTVGEQLREVSNNTSLIASTGAPDGNTVPSQFAVKTYTQNSFLADVTVGASLPLTIADTSTQDGQGYWRRTRQLGLSVNTANGLARLDGAGLIPSTLLPSSDSVSEGSLNLYFTQTRARQSISVTGSLGYDPATGVLSYTTPPAIGTDLSYDAFSREVRSSTGTDAVLPLVSTDSAGLQAPTGFGSITYAAQVALDLAVLAGQVNTITLTGSLILTTSNLANGRVTGLRLIPGASARDLTFPADWKFVSAKPATLPGNKVARLTIECHGTTNADVVAAIAIQP